MQSSNRAGAYLARLLIAVLAAGAFALSGTTPASAHASVQMYGESATSGGYGAVFIRVPHAKPGLVTNTVEVQIPEGVTAVKPQRIAGWTEKVNYAADGKTATSVTWSGGDLPDTSFQDFGISVKFPATPGVTLYFKTVQTLSDGSLAAWIEIPAAGVDAHSLSYPSPSVKLAETAGHGHGADSSTGYGKDTSTDMTEAAKMTATVKGKNVRLTVNAPTNNAGSRAVLRVAEGTKSTTVISVKLDGRGDLVRTIPMRKTGKGGYKLDAGDKLELVIGGKVVASATI